MIGSFTLGVIAVLFVIACVMAYVIITSNSNDEETPVLPSRSPRDPRYAIVEQIRAEAAVLNQKAAKRYTE